MQIPYVIDNQVHRMADVLNDLLSTHKGRSMDVATALQMLANHPQVSRGDAVELIRLLRHPQPGFIAKELRRAYQGYATKADAAAFMAALKAIRPRLTEMEASDQGAGTSRLRKEDLRMICFDHLCS